MIHRGARGVPCHLVRGYGKENLEAAFGKQHCDGRGYQSDLLGEGGCCRAHCRFRVHWLTGTSAPSKVKGNVPCVRTWMDG